MSALRAIVLTVGDEITAGRVPDTNSTYVVARLHELGLHVLRIASVGDEVTAIALELDRSIDDAEMVIVTGGLGPTDDDLTKQAVARALSLKLAVDHDLRSRLDQRFKGHRAATPRVIERLATIPEGAITLANRVGAAVGLALEVDGKHVFVLPGVPQEMEAVFEEGVVPLVERLPRTGVVKSRVIKTVGIRESEIAAKLDRVASALDVKLGYLPKPEGVELRLTAEASSDDMATEALDTATDSIVPLLRRYVYSVKGMDINFVVGDLLLERSSTIAVAESCTGGLIGHLLTQVPGISASLDRVVVAYSNRAKVRTLAVGENLLRKHGAVSSEVARAMACGVREAAGTDLGLSTTGIAGPGGGSPDKPVGLVYFSLAHDGGCITCDRLFRGSREIVKLKAAIHGLDMVRCHLLGLEI